jgi:hypothetical protein
MAILLFQVAAMAEKWKILYPEEKKEVISQKVKQGGGSPGAFGFNGDNDWECLALVGTKSTSRCTQLMIALQTLVTTSRCYLMVLVPLIVVVWCFRF